LSSRFPVAARERKLLKPPIANQCSKSETVNFCTGAQKKFNSRLVAPSLEYLLGCRTVTYNPPRHLGVGFRCDF
jgi:hypothetical protein